MTLLNSKKFLFTSLFLSILSSSAVANHVDPMTQAFVPTPSKFYLGGFGGWGSTNNMHVTQYSTAFLAEAQGGALAINSFGNISGESFRFLGAQVGFLTPEVVIDPKGGWAFGPGIELEGYYMGQQTFTGSAFNNNVTRLGEHGSNLSLPIKRSVFLVNFVLNINVQCVLFHPYIAAGFGGALIHVSGAESFTFDPLEIGINHYNSNGSDTTAAFAGQFKIGLSYDFYDYVSIFAEYRRLYISDTHFVLGSTSYPAHAATSDWQVKLNPQYSNMGALGIRFNL